MAFERQPRQRHRLRDEAGRKLQHDVQVLTDDHIKHIDETLAQKDKEILQV